MKKYVALILLLALTLCGCTKPDETQSEGVAMDMLEIKEKMFVAQVTDIYTNAADYLGQKLKYEGLFTIETLEATGAIYHMVIRYGPGCCDIDGVVGFEVKYDKPFPKQNDWVEVSGTLIEYEENGTMYLCVQADEIKVLEQRGLETVTQ